MDEFRERNSVNEAVKIACSRVVLDHEWVSAFSLWMHEHHIESPTKLDEQKRKKHFSKDVQESVNKEKFAAATSRGGAKEA